MQIANGNSLTVGADIIRPLFRYVIWLVGWSFGITELLAHTTRAANSRPYEYPIHIGAININLPTHHWLNYINRLGEFL